MEIMGGGRTSILLHTTNAEKSKPSSIDEALEGFFHQMWLQCGARLMNSGDCCGLTVTTRWSSCTPPKFTPRNEVHEAARGYRRKRGELRRQENKKRRGKARVLAALVVSSMSDEPELPQIHEEWLSDEHLGARAEFEPGPPPALVLATGNRRDQVARTNTSRSLFLDTPSFDTIPDILDTPACDDLESEAWTGSNQARLTKCALLASTRAVFPQFTHPAVSSGLAVTRHRPNGARHSDDCQKARRERQCSFRSKM